MFQTLRNAWKTQELKTKLLFTLLIVILYRLGSAIPVPFITEVTGGAMDSVNYTIQILAGDAFSSATLFALSVSPYITSSIIIQLLTVAIPALERLAKEGEEGKKKINSLTRIITMVLALITSFGYAKMAIQSGWTSLLNVTYNAEGQISNFVWNTTGATDAMGLGAIFKNAGWQFVVMIACYCAGAALVMWLAEKVNEHGIGNGISIILFANIIARMPKTFVYLAEMFKYSGQTKSVGNYVISAIWSLIIVAFIIAIVWIIVWFTESERRIPVQYAKRVVGRKMYGGQSSNLPIKLNMAGVMPVIFANSIVSIPGTLAMIFRSGWLVSLSNNYFNYNRPLYVLVSIILLFAFAYFYIMISFNPVEVANNIRNNGGAVPGIRPGKPTSDYIRKILHRITFIGAIFLCIVSEVPKLLVALLQTAVDIIGINTVGASNNWLVRFHGMGTQTFMTVAFAGTSLLIIVGVILETVRELEAQLTMRNYKGFLD